MKWNAQWIKASCDLGEVCPLFSKQFTCSKKLKKATLHITALGVYEATLNRIRVGSFVLAPGWTSYQKRLQYQSYEVTDLLSTENTIEVMVGKGWYRSPIPGFGNSKVQHELQQNPAGLLAQLELCYDDGSIEYISSDETWQFSESKVRFSEIYDGEEYDASFPVAPLVSCQCFDGPWNTLIAQQGEEIHEQDEIRPVQIFTTPAGETVIDFGQNLTGYIHLKLDAKKGEKVRLSHAEVLDQNGNFYTANYRSARAKLDYTCCEGVQSYQPKFTFYGFRYVRIDEFPGGTNHVSMDNLTAIAVHSELTRTGFLKSSNPLLNQLFDNVLWGQKGNFIDVPTDCPQRDERLGWTGDAQVFVRTAALNYNVERFFRKWLQDMVADQEADGGIGHVIPNLLGPDQSAGWADAATICPWQIYLAYGHKSILADQFQCMCKWIGYITKHTTTQYLWTGGTHFGDWLGLDAPSGSYKGASREDFIASAYYAYSTSLVIKAGKVLGKDISSYEQLYDNIVRTFQATYPVYLTQTECVLAAYFHLAKDCEAAARQLANMIEANHLQLSTGFLGTPYLLHVLSDYGYSKLAYTLLLRTEYPSWLYPVTKGATTIWEHWDGIMPNGSFWSSDMNSFNHYAYGCVLDWVYSVAAGIQTQEAYPGYEKIIIAPHPDTRLDWLDASLDTAHGRIQSSWKKQGNQWRYEIVTPVDAAIHINNQTYNVTKGAYLFYSSID